MEKNPGIPLLVLSNPGGTCFTLDMQTAGVAVTSFHSHQYLLQVTTPVKQESVEAQPDQSILFKTPHDRGEGGGRPDAGPAVKKCPTGAGSGTATLFRRGGGPKGQSSVVPLRVHAFGKLNKSFRLLDKV